MLNEQLDNEYARIRAEEREAQRLRIAEAYSRAPRLKELDEARAGLFPALGQRKITPEESKRRLEEIDREERQILASLGLPADALTLHVQIGRAHV